MEVTALCIRLLTFAFISLGEHIQKNYTQKDGFRIVTNRLQFFEYESVSFHCEGVYGSNQLRGIRNNKDFIKDCDIRRTSALTCTIQPAYDSDSGVYWCETEGGEKSNTVSITVTAGSVILESPALPVMEGENVTLRCRHKTDFTNRRAVFYKGGRSIRSSSAREMTIQNVSRSDEDLYKCSISGVGTSPGSWLAVRYNHPSLQPSSHVMLWVAVTISIVALVLLVVGLLHLRKHRVVLFLSSNTPAAAPQSSEDNQIVCGEEAADDEDSLTYAVVVPKQRKNKETADAGEKSSPCLETNQNRQPKSEKDEDESSFQPVNSTLNISETPQALQHDHEEPRHLTEEGRRDSVLMCVREEVTNHE